MKKLIILLIVMCVLGFLAFNLVSKDKDGNDSGMDTSDRDFAVENVEDIHKIFIATRNNEPITLTKEGNGWMVNGEFKAGDNQMNNLLAALQRVKIDHIPHPNAVKNVIRDIGMVGIKVELYDRDDNNMKTYYVGNSTGDLMGTYYLMEDASQPYAVKMPGFVGSMRGRFVLTAKDFRTMVFLDEEADDIQSVSIDYPKRQKESFKLYRSDDDEFVVDPYYPLSKRIKKPLSAPRVRAYLESFTNISSEYIDNNNDGRDTINQKLPFAILSIKTTDGEEKTMKIYPLNDLIDGNTDIRDVENLKKVHRVFAECSWGDFLLIQMRNLKKLLRPYAYFF